MISGLVLECNTSKNLDLKGIYILPPLRSSSPKSLPPFSSPLSLLFSLEVVFLYSSMYWTSSTNIDKNVNGGGRNKFGSKNWIPAYARAYLELEYVNVVWRRQSITNTDWLKYPWLDTITNYLLPLLIQIVVYSSVGDCHHDNKDAK